MCVIYVYVYIYVYIYICIFAKLDRPDYVRELMHCNTHFDGNTPCTATHTFTETHKFTETYIYWHTATQTLICVYFASAYPATATHCNTL